MLCYFFVMMNLLFTGQFCNLIWGKKYWRHFRNFISSQGRWIDGGVCRGLEDHQIIHTLFASADSGLKIYKKFAKEKKIKIPFFRRHLFEDAASL